MTPLDILVAARELISDPAHWCQTYAARDKYGKSVAFLSEDAFSFCALGAVARVEKMADSPDPMVRFDVDQFLNEAAIDLDPEYDQYRDCYIDFNDVHNHEEVLAMFDLAIEKSKIPVATYTDVC